MSDWDADRIAHHDRRDDLSAEPSIRAGRKDRTKHKPWAVCYTYDDERIGIFRGRVWRTYFAKESDAYAILNREKRNELHSDNWIEFEGERL